MMDHPRAAAAAGSRADSSNLDDNGYDHGGSQTLPNDHTIWSLDLTQEGVMMKWSRLPMRLRNEIVKFW